MTAALWLEREKPMLCGKQLMTRSFFLRDFVERKAIAAIPDSATGEWKMIFEGGHQLPLREDAPYTKDTVNSDEINAFCPSNMQSVMLDPSYAYGKIFYPKDICEEWHKVFLYMCAVSDMEWDARHVREIYERFLCFLEENICLSVKTSSVISKEKYSRTLLSQITDFRRFLKGGEVPIISKDLLQTMNSRYTYLPHIWELARISSIKRPFSVRTLLKMTDKAVDETDKNKKGALWEEVAAYVLRNIDGWKITGSRIRVGLQEIDLSIANVSLDDELWKLGAYILVECKNWRQRVDVRQIRNIAHISAMKGNKTAILFAANGITANAQDEIERLAAVNLSIICITAGDLRQITSKRECRLLILKRWNELINNTNEHLFL